MDVLRRRKHLSQLNYYLSPHKESFHEGSPEINNNMDVLRKDNHSGQLIYLTPQKEPLQEVSAENFSFSDWKKKQFKRSPTSEGIKRNPLIKIFYNNEQKKIIKIHRSFDSRQSDQISSVKKLNDHIKKLINDKEFFSLKEKVATKGHKRNSSENIQEMNSTPYFTRIKNKMKFPRDIFSSRNKRFRA